MVLELMTHGNMHSFVERCHGSIPMWQIRSYVTGGEVEGEEGEEGAGGALTFVGVSCGPCGDDSCRLFENLLDAVEYVHSCGLVHRGTPLFCAGRRFPAFPSCALQ